MKKGRLLFMPNSTKQTSNSLNRLKKTVYSYLGFESVNAKQSYGKHQIWYRGDVL